MQAHYQLIIPQVQEATLSWARQANQARTFMGQAGQASHHRRPYLLPNRRLIKHHASRSAVLMPIVEADSLKSTLIQMLLEELNNSRLNRQVCYQTSSRIMPRKVVAPRQLPTPPRSTGSTLQARCLTKTAHALRVEQAKQLKIARR